MVVMISEGLASRASNTVGSTSVPAGGTGSWQWMGFC
nr:hypothetical protein [Tanacetum cinerariifolium]